MSYPSHLRVYHYIREIAQSGSLSAASDNLNVAVSALSRWINTVEQELDANLFIRRARGLELTEAGRAYVAHAHKILDEEERLKDRLHLLTRGDWGVVKVASVEGTGETIIPHAIAEVCQTRKDIEFEILIGKPDRNLGYLLDRRADLGVFLNRPDAGNLELLFEYPAPIFVEMRKDHPLSSKKVLSLVDLAEFPLLLPSQDTSIYQMIQLAFAEEGLSIRSNVRANSILPQRNLLARTDFLSFGSPLHWEPWVETVLRPIGHSILQHRAISAFCLQDRPLTAAATYFLEVLEGEIRRKSEKNTALFT